MAQITVILTTAFLVLCALTLFGMVYAVGQSKDREAEDREQEAYLKSLKN